MLDLFSRKDFIIFSTRDYAAQTGMSMSAASKKLTRLAEKKLLEKITKGIWANTAHPWFTPLACVPLLLGKEQGISWSDTQLPYLMADAEKALLDTFYIATRKGRRFASLPELDLKRFKRPHFRRMLKELPFPDTIRAAISTRAGQHPSQ